MHAAAGWDQFPRSCREQGKGGAFAALTPPSNDTTHAPPRKTQKSVAKASLPALVANWVNVNKLTFWLMKRTEPSTSAKFAPPG